MIFSSCLCFFVSSTNKRVHYRPVITGDYFSSSSSNGARCRLGAGDLSSSVRLPGPRDAWLRRDDQHTPTPREKTISSSRRRVVSVSAGVWVCENACHYVSAKWLNSREGTDKHAWCSYTPSSCLPCRRRRLRDLSLLRSLNSVSSFYSHLCDSTRSRSANCTTTACLHRRSNTAATCTQLRLGYNPSRLSISCQNSFQSDLLVNYFKTVYTTHRVA